VLQGNAACCSVLQCVAVCCSVHGGLVSVLCCSVLQRGAVCCRVMQCVAVCCSVLQCAWRSCERTHSMPYLDGSFTAQEPYN